MFQNYIFDLYGTLIDINTNEWDMPLWNKMAIYYGYKGAIYTGKELKDTYGDFVDEEKKKVQSKHKDYKVIDIEIKNVFEKLFTAKNVYPTEQEIIDVCGIFRCYSTDYIKLYDGVIDLLDTLKAKNKKIYLLSNAQRHFTINEMKMLGIYDYFDGIFISSDLECSKPDVNYYKMLFEKYNLKKDESIMIGNDYLSDIGGASDFGIKSLYIHQDISPEIKGKLRSNYTIMNGNVKEIKKLIVK